MPRRIIRPPYKKSMPQGGYLFLYDCDDGNTYTIKQLTVICRLKEYRSLHNRIRSYGWDSDKILVRGPLPKEEGGNAEWESMKYTLPKEYPQDPRYIIREPYYVSFSGKSHPLVADCDDGNTYTYAELAEICGLKPTTIRNRISRYGWDSERVLKRGTLTRIRQQPSEEWLTLGD